MIYSSRHKYHQDVQNRQMMDYALCLDDPKKFSSLMKINGAPLVLNDDQEAMMDEYHKFSRVICKHRRRVGASTVSAVYALWFALMKPYKVVSLVAPSHAWAITYIQLIAELFKSLPAHMKPNVFRTTKHTIEFDNGSTIRVTAATPTALRGLTLGLLILADFAHVPDDVAAELLAVVGPAIATGTSLVMFSDDSGHSTTFTNLWKHSPYHRLEV